MSARSSSGSSSDVLDVLAGVAFVAIEQTVNRSRLPAQALLGLAQHQASSIEHRARCGHLR